MIPRLLVLSPNDSRPINELLGWINLIADAGVTGFVLREIDRDPRQNLDALELAAARFPFVIRHHRTSLPDSPAPIVQALHIPNTAAPPEGLTFGCSCHDADELDRAFAAGASYAFLSPVFRPSSKPQDTRIPIGIHRFMELSRARRVFALGGINPHRYRELLDTGAFGAAVLGDFASLQTRKEALEHVGAYASSSAKGKSSAS